MFSFGRSLESTLGDFANLFTEEGFAGILVSLILLLTVVIAVWTFVWWYSGRKSLIGANNVLAQFDGGDEKATREKFARNFGAIDPALVGIDAFRASWREFRETLEHPSSDDASDATAQVRVRNEARPQDYFTLANLGLSAGILRSLPNLLVGVGLVLTFIGLIAALGTASDGLDIGTDQNAMTDVLRKLLQTAGAKFYASATALGCSIILGLVQRVAMRDLAGRLHVFNDGLEERLLYQGSSFAVEKQLSVLKEMRDQFADFNETLAVKIGDQVQAAIRDSNEDLGGKLESVVIKLEQIADATGTSVSNTVGDKLDGALSDTLAAMDTTLREIQTSFGKLPAEIANAASALGDATSDMQGRMEEEANTNAKATGERLASQMDPIIQALQAAAAQIGTAQAELDDTARSTGKAVSDQIVSSGAAAAEGLDKASAPLLAAAEGLQAAMGQFAQASEVLGKRSDALGAALAAGTDAHAKISTELATTGTAISDAGRESTRVLETARSAARTTGEATTKLADSMASLDALVVTLNTARESLEGSLEQANSDMADHLSRYDGLDEGFAAAFETFQETITTQQQRLVDHVNDIDENLSRAAGQLAEAAEEMAEAKTGRTR